MNIIRYSIRSFFTNEYYSIIRFASKRLFVATLASTFTCTCKCLITRHETQDGEMSYLVTE